MKKEVRYLLILAALLGTFSLLFSQDLSIPPPEPMMAQQSTTTGDCGGGDGGGGPGIPPPVGLCLPINDYLLPLLLSGVALGAFSLILLERKQEITFSAQ